MTTEPLFLLTALRHLADVDALLCRHEAQHRKHHEAREEAGPAVDHGEQEGVPTEEQREPKSPRGHVTVIVHTSLFKIIPMSQTCKHHKSHNVNYFLQ